MEHPPQPSPASASTPIRWWIWLLPCLLLAASGGVTAVAGVLHHYGQDLPKLESLDNYRPDQASRVYSHDGTVLGIFATERRSVVHMDSIPPMVRNAFLASEDAEFYQHEGLDYTGMLRALYHVLKSGGRFTQGGSTITQQVVKTFLLTPEKKISRKIKEIILARRLEKHLSKDDILTLYLNQIYFAHGNYGIQEAARFYYGCDVGGLKLAQAAMLAGLIQSPERLSPIKHPEAALRRRTYVLDKMLQNKFIDKTQANATSNEPISAKVHRAEGAGLAPHFVEHIRRKLIEEMGRKMLYTGGLRVISTLDAGIQRAANEAVTSGLLAIDRRRGFVKAIRRLGGARARQKFLADRPTKLPVPGHIVPAVVTGRSEQTAGYTVELGPGISALLADKRLGRYSSEERPAEGLFQAGDVVRVSVRPHDPKAKAPTPLDPEFGPQAALVCLDPHTRHVRALVGGDPSAPDAFNRVTQARRQPGSAFKPIVYGAALATKRIHPASIILDAPEIFRLQDGRWAPQNYDRSFRGPMRLREGLAKSVNTIAIKVLQQIGIEQAIRFARSLGIRSPMAPYLPLALGSSALSPLELANAYAVFASGGKLEAPVFIQRVEGPTGDVLYRHQPKAEQAVEPALAYLITDMMTSVVQSGTAARARQLGRPAAGKTGTTNNHTDAWFSGFTPELVATAWVGFDDNRSLGRGEQGARTALPIWLKLMKQATEGLPIRDFLPPKQGIVVKAIDKESGLLAPEGMAPERILLEHFLTGSGPTEVAPLPDELTEESFLLNQLGGEFEPTETDPGEADSPPGLHPAAREGPPTTTGSEAGRVSPPKAAGASGQRKKTARPASPAPLDAEDLPER